MSLVPNIGEEYAGSIIVDIKEEEKEMGAKIRHRKIVTLENGLMMVEDIMEDKLKLNEIKGDYKELKYNEVEYDYPDDVIESSPTSKKKRSSASASTKKLSKSAKKAEEEAEREKRRQQEEEEEKARKEKILQEARELKRQAEEKAAQKKAAEEEDKKWKPQPAAVYSSKDPDAPKEGVASKPRATWKMVNDNDDYPEEEQECWVPQDILLFAPGKEPPKGEDSSDASSSTPLPQGSWGYAPGALSGDDDDDRPDGWRPNDVVVYPPGVAPPAGFKADGVYTYAPKDKNTANNKLGTTWPPPVDEAKKKKLAIQRLPKEFQDMKPLMTTAQPKSRKDKFTSTNPTATWAYPTGKENADDNLWSPQDLLIYPPEQDPPEEESSSRPRGVWGYAPGSEPDPKTGLWRKKDILVYPPGVEPDPTIVKPQGIWEYPPDSTHTDFPPPVREPKHDWKPQAAWVFPKAKCPKYDPKAVWKPQGVWHYHKNPLKDDKWRPQELWAYAKGQEPRTFDKNKPHGLWGLAPDAQPDKNGNWKPEDMWFYAPGETPPESDWRPQGTWTYPPQKLKIKWPPPPSGKFDKIRDAGELNFKPKGQPDDWKPQGCYVGRMKKALEDAVAGGTAPTTRRGATHPKGKSPLGVWKYNNKDDKATPADDKKAEDWMSKKVRIHPPGVKPENKDTSKPHGRWGFSPDAEPDEDGEWDPSDLWFIPPNETPPDDDEWIPAGEWTADADDEPKFKPKGESSDDWKPQNVSVGSNKDDDKSAVGVWKFGAGDVGGDDDDDDEWKPSQVCLYPPGEKPENMDDVKVHGLWGLAPDAEPDDDGEWKPSDVWFVAPDATPPADDEWISQGVWTSDEKKPPKFKPKGEESFNWKRQTVSVGKKSNDDSNKATGVWKFGAGGDDDDDDDDEWRPSEVCIYPPGKEPDEDTTNDVKARGRWGLAPDAEPDDDGEWKPSDVWFVPSDATPPEDDEWIPMGVWTSDEKKPPPRFKPKGEDTDDWKPQTVSVGKKPDDDKDATGVWKFGAGGAGGEDDDEWRPSQVCIYPPGKKPEDMDEKKPHGVWGMSPGAVPDEDGNFKQSDMWFFGAGETPPDDDEWVPHGVWTSEEEKPKKKKKPKKTKSGKSKKEKPKEETPKKKKSYLPSNWKEQQSQFGSITTTSYVSDYSGSDNVLVKTAQKTEVVELVSPTRRSQKLKVDKNALPKTDL